jgi:beta-glucanase (GH16 family)
MDKRHLLAPLALVLTVASAASASAAGPTTTITRAVAAPGTYDLTLSITAKAKSDVAKVRVGRSVRRSVTLAANKPRRVRIRVEVSGTKVVARVAAKRARPRVKASIKRVAAQPTTPTPAGRSTAIPATTPAASTAHAAAPVPSRLAWADEFDGSAGALPSAARWTAETGDNWGNGSEWQSYTADAKNASLDGGGNLAIVARKEPGAGQHGITSARMSTKGKFSFRHGRLEARMRLPAGKGMFPAFWAMGDDLDTAGWPANGEIDVMEALGDEPFAWYAHVHGPDADNNDAKWGKRIASTSNLTSAFHTYGVVWSPSSISWTFDGVTVGTVTPSHLPAGARWVYDHNFHVLLNLAVGAPWPGYPDATTSFPSTLLVDWVRVYQ